MRQAFQLRTVAFSFSTSGTRRRSYSLTSTNGWHVTMAEESDLIGGGKYDPDDRTIKFDQRTLTEEIADLDLDLLNNDDVLAGQFKIVSKIAGGGFGFVYKGVDVLSGTPVAIKAEPLKVEIDHRVLNLEVRVIKSLQGKRHACQVFGSGADEKVRFCAMTLCGKSLGDLRKQMPNMAFSTSTGIRLMLQVLEAVKDLHSIGFLHRDIKPSNFAMGGTSATERTVFMLDFGLCRRYRDANGNLRPPRAEAGFRGTYRYASLDTHRGIEMGRHDDLWSMFYMMVDLLRGRLPWQLSTNADSEDSSEERVMQNKVDYDVLRLCHELPPEIAVIGQHLKLLEYHSDPKYDFIRGCLKKICRRQKIKETDPFDWEVQNPAETVVSKPSHKKTKIHKNIIKDLDPTVVHSLPADGSDDESAFLVSDAQKNPSIVQPADAKGSKEKGTSEQPEVPAGSQQQSKGKKKKVAASPTGPAAQQSASSTAPKKKKVKITPIPEVRSHQTAAELAATKAAAHQQQSKGKKKKTTTKSTDAPEAVAAADSTAGEPAATSATAQKQLKGKGKKKLK